MRFTNDIFCSLLGASIPVLLLGACQMNFAPSWKLEDSRILSIQSTPPTLDEDETSQLEAIIYTPGDEADIEYKWSWCPIPVSAENRYECPRDQLEKIADRLSESGSRAQKVASFLEGDFNPENKRKVSFPYPTDRETTMAICKILKRSAGQASSEEIREAISLRDCKYGFNIAIRLKATIEGEQLIAKKELELVTSESTQSNQNPNIRQFQIRPATEEGYNQIRGEIGWADKLSSADDWYNVQDDDSPLNIDPSLRYELRSDIDTESIETWRPPAPVGSGKELEDPEKEVLAFKWYLEKGALERSQTLYNEELNTLKAASRTKIDLQKFSKKNKIPEDCPGYSDGDQNCDIELWSIVRDGRLGIDFRSLRLNLKN